MDQVKKYKAIAQAVIKGVYDRYDDAPAFYQIIQDDRTNNYLLFQNCWQKDTDRFYGTVIHIEVKHDGKVWLHHDGTELIIADWLLDRGVLPEHLVLAFKPESFREDTGFAVK